MTEEAQYHTAEVPVMASSHTQYAHSTSPPQVHSLTDEVSVSNQQPIQPFIFTACTSTTVPSVSWK